MTADRAHMHTHRLTMVMTADKAQIYADLFVAVLYTTYILFLIHILLVQCGACWHIMYDRCICSVPITCGLRLGCQAEVSEPGNMCTYHICAWACVLWPFIEDSPLPPRSSAVLLRVDAAPTCMSNFAFFKGSGSQLEFQPPRCILTRAVCREPQRREEHVCWWTPRAEASGFLTASVKRSQSGPVCSTGPSQRFGSSSNSPRA